MTTQLHKATAFLLAFLVLFSSTGFGMNIRSCCCTSTLSEFMSNEKKEFDCCKTKQSKAKHKKSTKQGCCSKNVTKKPNIKENDSNNTALMIKKQCCASICKIAKKDVNPNFIAKNECFIPGFFTLVAYNIPFNYFGKLTFTNTNLLIPPPNKAPPRCFGYALLHWFQTYLC